jgi:glycosyltransferase involved in cell wall biosynthesis
VRIGLSAYLAHRGADYRAAGVSVYTEQLLAHLPQAAPQNSYVAFVGPDAPRFEGVERVETRLPTYRPEVRIGWEQTGLLIESARRRIDLLHGTVNVLPAAFRKPAVVTVHDLSFLAKPRTVPRSKALYLRYAVRLSARAARRVIAVSQSTKQDLVEEFGVAPEKIDVVYPGVDERFHPLAETAKMAFRTSLTEGRPYILHVGTIQPRKNIDVLIRAFARLKAQERIPHLLLLAGARGWMYDSVFRLVTDLGLQAEVRFADYVAPTDLPLWYNCADVFAYPSSFEGFGLPVLEAMACGLPVVTSASSSLLEVAGDAATTVEPGSDEALAQGVARILNEDGLRERLRLAGLQRVRDWTWDATARATAEVYRRTVEGP